MIDLRGARFLHELTRAERDALPPEILPRWQEAATGGDAVAFARWLDQWPAQPPPPDFARLAEALRPPARANPPAGTELPADFPFREIFGTFLAVAWRDVAPPANPAIAAGLSLGLARALLFLWRSVLLAEFDRIRPPSAAALSRLIGDAAVSLGDRAYRAFVTRSTADGGAILFEAYPAAARATAEMILDWREAAVELDDRLRRDRAALERAFGTAGEVDELIWGVGDPHERGRTVARLRFANGRVLFYKPRPCDTDATVGGWLNSLAAEASLLPMRVPRTVVREGYGWCEGVAERAPAKAREANDLARRLGQLAACFHALSAADLHRENWVLVGADALPVDLETLLHPRLPAPPAHALDAPAAAWPTTPLDTVIPPAWTPCPGGAVDLSPLGASRAGVPARWVAVNSDGMAWIAGPSPSPTESSLSPAQLEAFLAGFQRMQDCLARHDVAGIRQRLARLPRRVVHRPTWIYQALLAQSVEPSALRSGIERSLVLHQLAQAPARANTDAAWARLPGEIEALARLDIPVFRERPEAPSPLPDRPSAALVHASLQLRGGLPVAARAASFAGFLEEAERIGERLAGTCIDLGDDGAGWMAPGAVAASRWALAPVGDSLYRGRLGMAVFLAALAHRTGDSRWQRLATRAVRPLSAHLRSLPTGATLPVGLGEGVGAQVYGWTTLARLGLGDEAVECARHAARLLDPERLPEHLDLLGGVAGELVAQLAWHDLSGCPHALRVADACAEHLLARQRRDEHGAAWTTLDNLALCGMGHGAAGIALALARWSERRVDARASAAVRAALAFEAAHFDATAGNWRDRRMPTQPAAGAMRAWCHGGPGGVIARLAMGSSLSFPEVPVVLDALRAAPQASVDHLCCGTFGRVGALAASGEPHHHEAALAMAIKALERGLSLSAGPACDLAPPGLFDGLAGVGYALLRLEHPALPDVLAFR